MEERYITAIDLGTAKIALTVAKVSGDNIQVVYYSETPSDGIRNSNVFNPLKASRPIRKAIEEAENELKIKILQVAVGLPRYSVRQKIATGELPRTNPEDYISHEEIEMLKELALNQYPLENEETEIIYGAVAQSFSTEDQIQMLESDVEGTLSRSVEGNFKIFVGNRSATNAIDKVFNDLGISIAKKYFLPDVVARTVLGQDEMENGVALVDLGAGVTSVAIYHGGIMRHYSAIPFGGKVITSDIRTECSISDALAENIKLAYGACLPSKLANLSEKVLQIRYEDAPFKEVSVRYLSEIIDARAREIVDAVLWSIQQSNLQDALRAGIVITGGGANLANLSGLVKEMSGYSVRIGFARHLFSDSGCFGLYEPGATSCIGMVLAAKEDRLPDCAVAPEPEPLPEEEPVPEEEPATMEDINRGDTGEVFKPGEWEEVPPEPKKKQKKPRKRGGLHIIWHEVKETIDNLYQSVAEEDV